MNELARIERWIYSALSGDAQLTGVVATRIYHDWAPEGAAYPFVIFNFQVGEDTNGLGTCRILTRALYQVKIVGRELNDNARLVADRIDDVIAKAVRAQHPEDDSLKFSGYRESPISYTEPNRDSSRFFRHLGGLYRIVASAP
jgi:hypothetical protein